MGRRVKNFRDLGGIEACGGKKIKSGSLYRSGYLCKISEDTAARLRDARQISLVVDLRSPSELLEHTDVIPRGVGYIHLPPLTDEQNPSVNRENRLPILKRIMAKEGGARKYLSDMYRVMVTQKQSLEAFGKLIRLLISNDGATLWHCTQGKDRTGVATAAVLMALGVKREDIMRDYMRTNRSCVVKNTLIYIGVSLVTFSIPKAHSLNLLLTSRKCYMKAVFDEVDKVYGGDGQFLRCGIGLSDSDIRALQEKYLV